MPELTGAGSMRRPTVAWNGIGRLVDDLGGRTGADRPLDADRRRFAEFDVDPELAGQRLLDHLLLYLAIERNRYLLPDIVLPEIDQRILLGQLGKGRMQRSLVGAACRARRPSPASAARNGGPRGPSAAGRSHRRSGYRRAPKACRSGLPSSRCGERPGRGRRR